VEERKSWLPAGLESSGWQPDDRASQRSGSGSKRSGGAPDASGAGQPSAETSSDAGPSASSSPWQPYDPKRPESKRSRKSADPEPADAGQAGEHRQEKAESKAEQSREPEGERDKPEDAGEKDGDRDGQGGRSDVDAMGQDKHRQVIGQRVGASRAKQLAYYGTFIAFVIVAYLGLKVAVSHFDKAPAHDTNQAPWSKPGAPDEPLGGFTPKTKGEKGPTNFQ
jgi:hypothetical protein